MNEVAETPAAAAPVDAAAATPGQRLKAARERRGLSSQKAADQMHLDHWVIEALESDQFEKIGPSVFAKGHLKHYAGMLGLPAAEIMAGYGAPPPAAPASQPAGLRMRTQEPVGIELPWGTIAGAAIAAVVIAGLVWLRPWRPHAVAAAPAAAPAPLTGAAQAAPSIDAATATATATDSADEPQDGAAMAPSTAPAAAPPAAAALASLPGAGRARLRLSFSADSRVEVYDAAGKSVFAGLGRANSVKTVAGDAPLRVYLNVASGVQLAINNRVVAIGPQFVAGDVARFEAGADGVLRRDTHSQPRPHG